MSLHVCQASPETCRDLVDRVLRSASFQRAERQRDFLTHICERTLGGHAGEVTETEIGHFVFGRPLDYNSGDDNIVRVAARQLRAKLREYFDTEGRDEPLTIEIPKGSYVPVFTPQQAAAEEKPAPVADQRPSRLPWVLAAVLAAVCAGLAWDNLHLREKTGSLSAAPNPVSVLLFNSAGRVNVVLADNALAAYQGFLGQVVTLEDYAVRKYPPLPPDLSWPGAEGFFSGFLQSQLTSLADAAIVAKVAESAGEHRTRIRVRHARDILARDFQIDNHIIIGGIRANPWASLFENSLNFRYQINRQDGRGEIANLHPQPAELPLYTNRLGINRTGSAYARVALVPNLAHNGKILLIAGVTAPSTESAGDFMLDPDSIPSILKALKIRDLGQASRFELLFETTILEGVTRQIRLIAVR